MKVLQARDLRVTSYVPKQEKLVSRLRQISSLPVAVGFGVSKPEEVQDVWR